MANNSDPSTFSLDDLRRLPLRPFGALEVLPLLPGLGAVRRGTYDLALGFPRAPARPETWGEDGMLPVHSVALGGAFVVLKLYAGRSWLGREKLRFATFLTYEGTAAFEPVGSRDHVANAVGLGMDMFNQMARVHCALAEW